MIARCIVVGFSAWRTSGRSLLHVLRASATTVCIASRIHEARRRKGGCSTKSQARHSFSAFFVFSFFCFFRSPSPRPASFVLLQPVPLTMLQELPHCAAVYCISRVVKPWPQSSTMDGAAAPWKSKVHVDGWLRKIAEDFAGGNAAVIEAMRQPPFLTRVTSSAILTWTSSAATWNHYNHDTLQNHAIGKRHRIQLSRVVPIQSCFDIQSGRRMHAAAAAPSSNQPFFLELQRTMYYKTQKTMTTTTTTCSSSSCSGTNVEFLLQSFSTAPEVQKRHLTSPSKKKQKTKQFSFFLSLSLSLSLFWCVWHKQNAQRISREQKATKSKGKNRHKQRGPKTGRTQIIKEKGREESASNWAVGSTP